MAVTASAIDHCLPQTQCGQCGYPRCREYADALAEGTAEINQCPPGADYTISALARLLQQEFRPLNTRFGLHRPKQLAIIDEQTCIGCVLCIKACPVDAIVGAAKLMHSVIAKECTGCELCLPVCPTDCISMYPPAGDSDGQASPWPGFTLEQIDKARRRNQQKEQRLAAREALRRRRKRTTQRRQMQNEIRAAVARVRTRRSAS